MAKINDVQVIEKNTCEKIQWEQDGYRLSFDDALSIKVTKYQGDEARTLDVCMDRGGDLMLGTSPAAAMWPRSRSRPQPIPRHRSNRRKASTSPAIPTARP